MSKPLRGTKRLVPLPAQPINNGLINFDEVQKARETLRFRDYQTQHLGFFLNEHRAIDRSDAGTGKTPVMCMWLYARSRDDRCIWTMPKSLMAKNYEELLLWSNLQPHQIVMVDGDPEQRKQQMDWRDARVFLMGFDSFANNFEYLQSRYGNLKHLCGDEFHKGFATHGKRHYKNPNNFIGPRRTVMFYDFMKRGGGLLAATGTLINGRLTSAFPVIQTINPLYYQTYENFLLWHSICDEWGNPIYWKNHERLSEILDRHGRRITYEQAYGDEPKQIFVVPCTMGRKQQKAYDEFEERAILELDNGDCLESDSSVLTLRRCLEIMQVPESMGIIEDNPYGKEARLADEVETAMLENEQLLIFEPMKKAQQKWKDLLTKLGRRVEVMNGDVTGNARMWQDKNFRTGEIQDLICSPDVAGVGFNWEHVNTVIFMALDWQDTTFIQNYRRALRGGRTKKLRILVMQYKGSVDVHIARKVNAKSDTRTRVEGGTSVKISTK